MLTFWQNTIKHLFYSCFPTFAVTMRIHWNILFSLLAYSTVLCAQNPIVTEKFDQLYIGENFDSSNSYWTTLSNNDNLLIVQEGEYIMHRKSSVSPYAVMANFNLELDGYRLVTSIKLDKSSAQDGSIGVIFMAQPDGKGGFVFEINKNHDYRLRQITGSSYRYMTGTPKELGWVKNEVIKGLNLPNLVEIRTAEKKYDLFVNNSLLTSFEVLEYKTGGIGFIIGPASKGKADFLYLFTNEKAKHPSENPEAEQEKKPASPETDIISLAESIINLKTQINKLQEENDDLKGIVAALKSGEKEQQATKQSFDKQIKNLDGQLKKASLSFDSLMKVNTDLMKYKELVKGNDNGDLVINLSKNLKNEKLLNDDLKKTNKTLVDSINNMKLQLNQQKLKPASSTIFKPSEKTNGALPKDSLLKKKEEFSLPKEN